MGHRDRFDRVSIPAVLERFTEPARHAVSRAETRLLRHHYVGTEHLFGPPPRSTRRSPRRCAHSALPRRRCGADRRMVTPAESVAPADVELTPEATRAVLTSTQ